jgi:hypothetical protein
MKTSTSSLSVNRLLTLVFTSVLLIFAGTASAFTKYSTVNNTGIEYASLAATATENSVFISWVTASEQNNSHFEVERSTDMKAFKTVAMVLDGFAATGTTTGKSYKFKEAAGDLKKGKTVYYRLKQIDNDNQVHYSAVMAVQINTTVTVFPASNKLNAQAINTKNVYPNNQILLSKQTTISMGQTNTAAGSIELTAAVLNPGELILGTEFYTPKLTLA